MTAHWFVGNDFSDDKDCSLIPANIYTGEDAKSECFCRDKRAWQSAPCVVRTPGGRMFCYFSGDNSGVGDECPNNYNVLMLSDDDGRTWQENVLVLDHPDSVRMHAPILFMAPDSRLWLFWAQSYIHWDSRGGMWAITCDDPDAETLVWSEPRRLCDGVMATPPIVTRKGEMLMGVAIWKKFPRHKFNCLPELEHSCCYASTDNGQTFSLRGCADAPDSTFDENTLVELNDGRLMTTIRCERSIAVSYSSDGGRTWTPTRTLMPHISSRSYLSRFSDGSVLLVTK